MIRTGGPWTTEAIIERPSINNVPYDLAIFGKMTFLGSWAGTQADERSFDQFPPSPASEWRHGLHMYDSSGHDMADPSGISQYGSFTVTQHSCDLPQRGIGRCWGLIEAELERGSWRTGRLALIFQLCRRGHLNQAATLVYAHE